MSKLKILFVIDGLGQSGSERSLAELFPYLMREQIQPMVVCLYKREGVHEDVIRQGIEVHVLDASSFVGRLFSLRKLIRSEQPHIIHTTLFPSNILGRIAAIKLSIPVMTSLVNTQYEPVRFRDPHIRPLALRMVQYMDGWSARHLTSYFHAVSESTKEAAVRALKLDPQKITVVQRGRDPERLGIADPVRKTTMRKQLGLTDSQKVIATVGRHEYQKGHLYLIEAVASLKSVHPDLVLLIAGRRGSKTEEMQDLCKKMQANGMVRLLGYREDVADVLAAADLFVFPSLFEGLPGAVIEAMALGLPIIASDIPPIREILKHLENAILVPPASPDELGKAIHVLLTDEALAPSFSDKNRKLFEGNYTIDIYANRMIELYRKIAASTKK